MTRDEGVHSGPQMSDSVETVRPRSLRFYLWVIETFGIRASDPKERLLRFAEEAIEVMHAGGLEMSEVQALIVRNFGKSRGDLGHEIGQTLLTLEALGECLNINAADEADNELQRVTLFPKQYWVDRHNAKVKHGITTGRAE